VRAIALEDELASLDSYARDRKKGSASCGRTCLDDMAHVFITTAGPQGSFVKQLEKTLGERRGADMLLPGVF
jgi:hypothetical protein